MPKSKLKSKSKNNSYKIIVGALSVVCSVVLTVFIVHLFVRAGVLNPSEAPGDTMSTLEDIYCAISIDCTLTDPPYDEDSPGAAGSTMYTLTEIYDKAVNFPLSSTGQTTSYTETVGEDPDYTTSNSFICDISYTDNGDGTVTDNCTGLMWKKCSEGLSGSSCGTGSVGTYNWENALIQCEGLDPFAGHSDWRLPNARELWSITLLGREIVDGKKAALGPYINQTVFPATVSSNYWSSTTYPVSTTDALNVDFSNGYLYDNDKTNALYVRCVRGQ